MRLARLALLALFYGLLFAPLIVVVGASFDGGDNAFLGFPPRDLSLRWYAAMPAQSFRALGLSLALAACTALCATLLGVPIAFGLARGRVPGQALLATLLRAPLQIPAVVTGLALLQLYYAVGAATGWFAQGSFVGLLVGHVFIGTPYVTGATVAVLARFSPALEDAAISLGATPWRALRRVTLPVILPGIWSGALYAFVVSFGDVPVALFLGSSDWQPFPVLMFQALEFDFDPAMLAVATVTLSGSFVLLLLAQRLVGFNPQQGHG